MFTVITTTLCHIELSSTDNTMKLQAAQYLMIKYAAKPIPDYWLYTVLVAGMWKRQFLNRLYFCFHHLMTEFLLKIF